MTTWTEETQMVEPNINLGEVIGLIVTGAGFLFGLGRVAQQIKDNTLELARLRADFQEHVKADAQGFKEVNAALLQIATKG